MQPDQPANSKPATLAHVVPFMAWLLAMLWLDEPAAWMYAIRAILGLGLLLWFRPWRWYGRPAWRDLPLAAGAGLAVLALWVGPESWAPEPVRTLYLKWGVLPLGRAPDAVRGSPFDPAVCGWALTTMRLAGSAFVIAIIEEFFWRGFLYRWLQRQDFLALDLGTVHIGFILAVSLVFGFEHNRWLAGFLAGVVYLLVMVRARSIWAACIAHIVTNLLLGLYVVKTGAWAYW